MKSEYLRLILAGILVLAGLLILSCAEDITGQFTENIPPETTVFIQGDTLNLTSSVQTIYWDGRDADGFIVAFYYTWVQNPQDQDWIKTTETSGTFPLQILGNDTSYRFSVRAEDNGGALDPTPATQVFPIKNSAPTISWTAISQIPDTTFTVASFTWSAFDLDGTSNLAFFEYALDDTTTWRKIPGTKRQITLTADSGLTAGEHAFYIKALDLAGATSPTIRMPEDPGMNWYVKEPNGRYLLIDDYASETVTSQFPDAFYKSMLDSILPQFGDDYTYWNIENLFPASTIQFIETMKYFERVIWYTDIVDELDPHFITSQLAIPQFRNSGGKIVYSVQFNRGFGTQGDPLALFPVESLVNDTTTSTGNPAPFRIRQDSSLYLDPDFQSHFPGIPPLPQSLKVSRNILSAMALTPKANSVPIYRFDEPEVDGQKNLIFTVIGQNDNGEYDFVFSSAPLNFLNKNGNMDEMFRIILRDIFQP